MRKRLLILFLFFLAVVPSYALNIDGFIDVYPSGYIVDRATPFAIHFSCWTSSFSTHSMVTAKLRIFSDTTTVINYTWSTVGTPAWRYDEQPISLHNPISVSNATVSGWLFGMSKSLIHYGLTTCKIRVYIPGSSLPYDISTAVPLYAWNTTSDAGWLEGLNPLVGANVIVLAKDSAGKILSSYITEDNHIIDNYPITVGYFKLGVPVGEVASLEFRNLNNQVVGTFSGPWTISAGEITNIGSPALVDSSEWNKYEDIINNQVNPQ